MADTLSGAFNKRQTFDDRGVLFVVMQCTAGGWAVVRMVEAELPNAVVAAAPVDDEGAAVATAERLRKEALN
jgi:hypothetical protein